VLDVIGQRVRVAAGSERSVHEIRLTFHAGHWMSRILTLPDEYWPGEDGHGVRVFHAGSKEEAEKQALMYIAEETVRRGQKVLAAFRPGVNQAKEPPARRLVGEYPVRLLSQAVPLRGTVPLSVDARTANLSESGIFVVTPQILVRSSMLSMVVRLPGLTQRLRGKVVWMRKNVTPWFPQGAGVELVEPPLSYRATIKNLR